MSSPWATPERRQAVVDMLTEGIADAELGGHAQTADLLGWLLEHLDDLAEEANARIFAQRLAAAIPLNSGQARDTAPPVA